MPNWCENDLYINHPDTTRLRVLKDHTALDGLFHSFRPMPEELHNIFCGSITIAGKEYDRWRVVEGKKIPFTQEETDALIARYGASNWYDWALMYWGCKWDADELSLSEQLPDGGYDIYFDTPWGPPTAFYDYLIKEGYTINASYYEGGVAFMGFHTNEYGDRCYDLNSPDIPEDLKERYAHLLNTENQDRYQE